MNGMSRIDFEDASYPINLVRDGEKYKSVRTQARYEGWVAALEHEERSRRYRRQRAAVLAVKMAAVAAIAAAAIAEFYALAHFAVKYW